MPDQYDPKQAPRSPYGRPAEQKPMPAPLDDPLAELARMVHGRPSQPSPAMSRAAAQAEPSPAGDLESELLNDLQASFAAVREAAAVAAPAARPQPLAPPLAPPPLAEPPRSRPTPTMPQPVYPTSLAPRPHSAPPPQRLEPRAEGRADIRPEFRLEPLDESRLVPIPQAPVMQPAALGGADRAAEPRVGGTVEPFPRLFERAARQAAAAPTAEDDEFAAFQLRPSSAPVTPPEAAAPPPRPPAPPAPSRWEKPEPAEPPPPVSRFAPPAAGAVPIEEDLDDEGPDPFVDAGLLPETGAPEDDAFETDDFGLAPEYAEEDDAEPQRVAARPARAREQARPPRGVLIVAAVVAIALVGGIAVAMFRTGQRSATAPATIMADGAPIKITPDTTTTPAAGDGDAQNKLIYDRVNSAEANNNTTLLTPDNGPIKGTSDANDGNAISRVILPGGPGYDARTAPGSAAPAATGSAPASGDTDTLGPKKVRTVVVRPDGTILSSSATDAPAGAQATDASANPAPASAAAPPTADTTTAAPSAAPATSQDDMAAISGTGGGALTITAAPDATSAPAIPTPAPAPRTEATVSAPAPAKAAKAPQVATANPNGPLDLTQGGSAAAALPATAADGFYVQVSSQRTEDAAHATYKDLQTRYPSILGKYDVSLQQATVPTRGTFYRVRVGPFSATDAQRLCDDLKSAGGDCVLARR